ncbi:MAG: TlyA family RNA methyltransferase [Maricaulaceae bacterium]
MTAKTRLDQALVARGLCETRAKAQAAIAYGGVRVDGRPATKPSQSVSAEAAITVTPPHPWVGRGGVKLAAALDHFGIDPSGRTCLDVGASTGGFTDVLLAHGARRVYAVDVGRDQLHPRLRADPRVRVMEGVDARTLSPGAVDEQPSLLVADLSFVSLTKVLDAPLALLSRGADVVVLVKPQFELDRRALDKRGVVKTPTDRIRALDHVTQWLTYRVALHRAGPMQSPIAGGDGNVEFLVAGRAR